MIPLPAIPADALALSRILGAWVTETEWMPKLHSQEEDLNFLVALLNRTEIAVIRDPDPVAFLALDNEEIPALHVAAVARGRGHGRVLLGWAKARRERLGLWAFQANEGALRFYEREGFRVAERSDGTRNDEHLPDLRLTWEAT